MYFRTSIDRPNVYLLRSFKYYTDTLYILVEQVEPQWGDWWGDCPDGDDEDTPWTLDGHSTGDSGVTVGVTILMEMMILKPSKHYSFVLICK